MRHYLSLTFLFIAPILNAQPERSTVAENYLFDPFYSYNLDNQELVGPVKSVVVTTFRIHLVNCDSTYDELTGLTVNHYSDKGKVKRIYQTELSYSESGDILSHISHSDGQKHHFGFKYTNGKLVSEKDEMYSQQISYDEKNRIIARTVKRNGDIQHPGWNYSYSYNDSNQLVSIQCNQPKEKIVYTYDSLGRINTIRDTHPKPSTIRIEYDKEGRRISETLVQDDSLFIKQLSFFKL